jgi:hypothetical protein
MLNLPHGAMNVSTSRLVTLSISSPAYHLPKQAVSSLDLVPSQPGTGGVTGFDLRFYLQTCLSPVQYGNDELQV